MKILTDFTNIVIQYFGSVWGTAAALGCVVLLFVLRKKIPGSKRLLLLLGCLLLALNPLTQWVMGRLLQEHLYWRFFWLVPMPVVIAVLVTGLAKLFKGGKKVIPFLLLAICLAVFGRSVYRGENYILAENRFKLPAEAAAVAAYICPEEGETKALVPDDLFCYIRQYSSRIRLLYGRNIAGFTAPVTNERIHQIHDLMNRPEYPVKKLLKKAAKYNCEYVVLLADRPLKGNPEKYGYQYQTTIGNYRIYRYSAES